VTAIEVGPARGVDVRSLADEDVGRVTNEDDRLATSPGLETVELSLFGPGYGECAVVHLGLGRWLIVDSCVQKKRSDPVALDYLIGMGVDPVEQVTHIVVTHWDDDHIQGSAKLAAICKKAELWIPEATRLRDVAALVLSDEIEPQAGLKQLSEMVRTARQTGRRVRLTKEEMELSQACLRSTDPPVSIYALSPSDEDVQAGFRQLMRLIPTLPNGRRTVGRSRHNDFSVVLHVTVGNQVILLGGDREDRGPGRGWQSVHVAFRRRNLNRASVYKVAHHGSQTGDNPSVWTEMAARPLIAVLSPFNRVRGGLPRRSDVQRLCRRAEEVAATSWVEIPPDNVPISSDPIMDADDVVVGESTISDEAAQPPLGQVRCRANARGGRWTIVTMGPAAQLC